MFCGDTYYDKLIIGQRVTHRGILELEILNSLKSTQQILKHNLYFFCGNIFWIESIHHWALTKLNSRYNAIVCQTYGIYISFLWDPKLQNYPYFE